MLPVCAMRRAGARAAARLPVVAAAVIARVPTTHVVRALTVAATAPRRAFSAAGAVTTVNVPGMGDSISEGTVSQWAKKKDEWLNADDVVVVLETDKVAVDVRTTAAGFLHETLADQGATVKVGSPLFRVRAGDKPAGAPAAAAAPAPAPAAAKPAAAAPAAAAPAPAAAAPAPAAPAPKAAAPAPASAPAAGKPAKEAAPPLKTAPPVVGARTESRVGMSRMRQRIAQRLKDSQNTAAMLTTFQECDMSAMYELRDKYKDVFEKTWGAKLGFMSIFVKAAAATLQELPVINAVIDGGDIVYRDYVDISVAVASPRGLVVPVLRNVEAQSMAQIELGMAELAKKARNDSITMEDMAGGTFTISNGGVFGSMMGTPIINPPQSAILGMHSIKPRPVAINGKVEIRPVMYLALTYDHRLIDGREAVTFLASLRDKVEDPRRLLLGV